MAGLAGIVVKIADLQNFFLLRFHGDAEEQKKQRSNRLLPSCLSPQVQVGLAHEGFRTIHYLYNIRHYIIINFFSDLAEILNARISNLKKNEETHY